MNKLTFTIGFVAVVALVVGGIAFLRQPTPPLGAAAGPDFLNRVIIESGLIKSFSIATTSTGSQTLSANEFTQWADSSVVSISPALLAASTITFPASSSVPSVVPKAGDTQSFCIRNATTTASIYLTLAGSTGINLVVASSSISAVGGKVLVTGKVGCITLVREAKTSTSFDIDALLTVFQ